MTWDCKTTSLMQSGAIIALGVVAGLQNYRISQLREASSAHTQGIAALAEATKSLATIATNHSKANGEVEKIAGLLPILQKRNEQSEAALRKIGPLVDELGGRIKERLDRLESRLDKLDKRS